MSTGQEAVAAIQKIARAGVVLNASLSTPTKVAIVELMVMLWADVTLTHSDEIEATHPGLLDEMAAYLNTEYVAKTIAKIEAGE
jgi:hypothetical protein